MTTPNRPPLSPAAQAVLNTAARRYAIDGDLQDSIAAALRAAADHIWHWDGAESVEHLKVIAAELEGINS